MNRAPGRPPESRVWVRRSTSPIILGFIPLLVGSELRQRRRGLRTIVRIGIGALVIVSVSSVRVVAGPDGLAVGFGPWGWPVRRHLMTRIRSVRVEKRSALRYMGLGLRILPHGTRIVLGTGDTLVVELDSGRTFGVTVPDAARAARFLDEARRELRPDR